MTEHAGLHRRQGIEADLAAKVLGGEVRRWGQQHEHPSTHQLFTDVSDERLVVVVPSDEPASAVDAALATGLALQGDRDLHVVLPNDEHKGRGETEPVWEATWARLPFVCTPVRLWGHVGGELTARSTPSEAVAVARSRGAVTFPTATEVKMVGPTAADRPPAAADAVERAPATPDDMESLEARLRARLAAPMGRTVLGMSAVLREVPATRVRSPGAAVDLLGVDRYGHIHAVASGFGRDHMLGLRALDHWVWAVAHRAELVALLRSAGADIADEPRILLDVMAASQMDDGTVPDVRLLLPQLEALDGQISWRVGLVEGWRDADETLGVVWHRRGQAPPDALERDVPTRFAWRMESHLRAHASARGESQRPPFLDTVEVGVIAPARAALQAVQAAGDAHRWLHHVRSSQAFALNLFGGLTEAQLLAVVARIDPLIVTCGPPVFEYTDPGDELCEATIASPHATQIDVRFDGRTRDGECHVWLIEVKLSEDGFGGCSAAEAPSNDRTDLCATAAPFGGAVDGCFQLRNHDREHRRRYDHYLPITEVVGRHVG